GRVEEIDAALDGAANDGAAAILGEHPCAPGRVAVRHHAQAQPGNLHAGAAKILVIHQLPAPGSQLPACSCVLQAGGWWLSQWLFIRNYAIPFVWTRSGDDGHDR